MKLHAFLATAAELPRSGAKDLLGIPLSAP